MTPLSPPQAEPAVVSRGPSAWEGAQLLRELDRGLQGARDHRRNEGERAGERREAFVASRLFVVGGSFECSTHLKSRNSLFVARLCFEYFAP